jgi:hypothetical protein
VPPSPRIRRDDRAQASDSGLLKPRGAPHFQDTRSRRRSLDPKPRRDESYHGGEPLAGRRSAAFTHRWRPLAPRTRPNHSCRSFTHQSSWPASDHVAASTWMGGSTTLRSASANRLGPVPARGQRLPFDAVPLGGLQSWDVPAGGLASSGRSLFRRGPGGGGGGNIPDYETYHERRCTPRYGSFGAGRLFCCPRTTYAATTRWSAGTTREGIEPASGRSTTAPARAGRAAASLGLKTSSLPQLDKHSTAPLTRQRFFRAITYDACPVAKAARGARIVVTGYPLLF